MEPLQPEPLRTVRVAANLTQQQMTQLVGYARANRWSLSTAIAVLVERGLNPAGRETSALP